MKVTKKKICEAILKQTGIKTRIITVEGGFLFQPNNKQTGALLKTTIKMPYLSYQSQEEWVEDFISLLPPVDEDDQETNIEHDVRIALMPVDKSVFVSDIISHIYKHNEYPEIYRQPKDIELGSTEINALADRFNLNTYIAKDEAT